MENVYSLSDIAAASREDGLGGNWILILLFAMIFGWNGNGFGGNNAATSQDMQRALDLNSIQNGQRDIEARVQEIGAENIGAIKDAQLVNLQEIRDNGSLISAGNANIINALTSLQGNMQNCCCDVKSTVMENRYLSAQNTAAINANTTAAMQKVLDTIQADKISSLQNEVNSLKTQNMFCGIPRISNYAYGVYPYASSGCGCGTAY